MIFAIAPDSHAARRGSSGDVYLRDIWPSLVATVVGLVENAFFKAILPGFDAQLRRSHR